MNVISKYCNSYLGLKFKFKNSDCCGREIYTVFVMYHICHKLEHWAHYINVVSVFVPISAFCHQTHYLTKFVIRNLIGGLVRGDPGSTLFIQKRLFCLSLIYLCCQSLTITITIMLYSIVLLGPVSSCSDNLRTHFLSFSRCRKSSHSLSKR